MSKTMKLILVKSIVPLTFIAFSAVCHAGNLPDEKAQALEKFQQIQEAAAKRGIEVTLKSVEIKDDSRADSVDAASSCTQTVELPVAGRSARMSATAPTCIAAAQMIAEGIESQ